METQVTRVIVALIVLAVIVAAQMLRTRILFRISPHGRRCKYVDVWGKKKKGTIDEHNSRISEMWLIHTDGEDYPDLVDKVDCKPIYFEL